MPQLEPTASLSLTCVWVLGVLLIPSSPWAYRVRELAVREDVLSPVPPLQDLWIPYFTITTDITASAMRVHTDGEHLLLGCPLIRAQACTGHSPPLRAEWSGEGH